MKTLLLLLLIFSFAAGYYAASVDASKITSQMKNLACKEISERSGY